MNVILAGTIFAVVLSAGIFVLLEIGRRIGVRQVAEEGESASKGLGAIEGAISVMTALNIACAPVTPSPSPFQANRVSSVRASTQATC